MKKKLSIGKKIISFLLVVGLLLNNIGVAFADRQGNYGNMETWELFGLGALAGAVTGLSCFLSPAAGAAGAVGSNFASLYLYYNNYHEYGAPAEIYGRRIDHIIDKKYTFGVVINKGQATAMVIGVACSVVAGVIEGAIEGGASAASSNIIQTIVKAIIDAIKNFAKAVVDLSKKIIQALIKMFTTGIKGFFVQLAKIIVMILKAILQGIVKIIKYIATKILEFMYNLVLKIKDMIKGAIHSIAKFFKQLFTNTKVFFANLGQKIKGWFVTLGQKIKGWFVTRWKSIKNIFKSPDKVKPDTSGMTKAEIRALKHQQRVEAMTRFKNNFREALGTRTSSSHVLGHHIATASTTTGKIATLVIGLPYVYTKELSFALLRFYVAEGVKKKLMEDKGIDEIAATVLGGVTGMVAENFGRGFYTSLENNFLSSIGVSTDRAANGALLNKEEAEALREINNLNKPRTIKVNGEEVSYTPSDLAGAQVVAERIDPITGDKKIIKTTYLEAIEQGYTIQTIQLSNGQLQVGDFHDGVSAEVKEWAEAVRSNQPLLRITNGLLGDVHGNSLSDNPLMAGAQMVQNLGLAPYVAAGVKYAMLRALKYKTYRGTDDRRNSENARKMAIAESVSGFSAGLVSNWDGLNSVYAGTWQDGSRGGNNGNPWASRGGLTYTEYFFKEGIKQTIALGSQLAWITYCQNNDINLYSAGELIHLAGASFIGAVVDMFRRDPGVIETAIIKDNKGNTYTVNRDDLPQIMSARDPDGNGFTIVNAFADTVKLEDRNDPFLAYRFDNRGLGASLLTFGRAYVENFNNVLATAVDVFPFAGAYNASATGIRAMPAQLEARDNFIDFIDSMGKNEAGPITTLGYRVAGFIGSSADQNLGESVSSLVTNPFLPQRLRSYAVFIPTSDRLIAEFNETEMDLEQQERELQVLDDYIKQAEALEEYIGVMRDEQEFSARGQVQETITSVDTEEINFDESQVFVVTAADAEQAYIHNLNMARLVLAEAHRQGIAGIPENYTELDLSQAEKYILGLNLDRIQNGLEQNLLMQGNIGSFAIRRGVRSGVIMPEGGVIGSPREAGRLIRENIDELRNSYSENIERTKLTLGLTARAYRWIRVTDFLPLFGLPFHAGFVGSINRGEHWRNRDLNEVVTGGIVNYQVDRVLPPTKDSKIKLTDALREDLRNRIQADPGIIDKERLLKILNREDLVIPKFVIASTYTPSVVGVAQTIETWSNNLMLSEFGLDLPSRGTEMTPGIHINPRTISPNGYASVLAQRVYVTREGRPLWVDYYGVDSSDDYTYKKMDKNTFFYYNQFGRALTETRDYSRIELPAIWPADRGDESRELDRQRVSFGFGQVESPELHAEAERIIHQVQDARSHGEEVSALEITIEGSADDVRVRPGGQLYRQGILNNRMLAQARAEALERLIREGLNDDSIKIKVGIAEGVPEIGIGPFANTAALQAAQDPDRRSASASGRVQVSWEHYLPVSLGPNITYQSEIYTIGEGANPYGGASYRQDIEDIDSDYFEGGRLLRPSTYYNVNSLARAIITGDLRSIVLGDQAGSSQRFTDVSDGTQRRDMIIGSAELEEAFSNFRQEYEKKQGNVDLSVLTPEQRRVYLEGMFNSWLQSEGNDLITNNNATRVLEINLNQRRLANVTDMSLYKYVPTDINRGGTRLLPILSITRGFNISVDSTTQNVTAVPLFLFTTSRGYYYDRAAIDSITTSDLARNRRNDYIVDGHYLNFEEGGLAANYAQMTQLNTENMPFSSLFDNKPVYLRRSGTEDVERFGNKLYGDENIRDNVQSGQ